MGENSTTIIRSGTQKEPLNNKEDLLEITTKGMLLQNSILRTTRETLTPIPTLTQTKDNFSYRISTNLKPEPSDVSIATRRVISGVNALNL
ncbi:hypothetical protein RHGRI_011347 [Rhododendron griersonianum]|uniref:Uncharacterized protein n=1 Tax=Rhododendron griersonianum TaxID=479676 RepID=A0AAV6KLJ3_9ERIC|nr:hypothetical protein RHGRI_011347 [Rhododendron griersonianum]